MDLEQIKSKFIHYCTSTDRWHMSPNGVQYVIEGGITGDIISINSLGKNKVLR